MSLNNPHSRHLPAATTINTGRTFGISAEEHISSLNQNVSGYQVFGSCERVQKVLMKIVGHEEVCGGARRRGDRAAPCYAAVAAFSGVLIRRPG